MSEAVTVQSLTMMTSTVSEESLARGTRTQTDKHTHMHTRMHTHTHTHIHRLDILYLKLFQSKTLKTKNTQGHGFEEGSQQ